MTISGFRWFLTRTSWQYIHARNGRINVDRGCREERGRGTKLYEDKEGKEGGDERPTAWQDWDVLDYLFGVQRRSAQLISRAPLLSTPAFCVALFSVAATTAFFLSVTTDGTFFAVADSEKTHRRNSLAWMCVSIDASLERNRRLDANFPRRDHFLTRIVKNIFRLISEKLSLVRQHFIVSWISIESVERRDWNLFYNRIEDKDTILIAE